MDVKKHLQALPVETIKDIIRKHDELYYIKLGQKKPQLIDALVNHYNKATSTHLIAKPGKDLRYVKQEEPPKEKIKVNITRKPQVSKPVAKLIEKIKLNITKKKPVEKLVEKLIEKIEDNKIELRPPEPEKKRGLTFQDALDFFGLDKDYSLRELKAIYKKLARQLHPDKKTGNEAKFKQLGRYYKMLVDYSSDDDEFFSAEDEE